MSVDPISMDPLCEDSDYEQWHYTKYKRLSQVTGKCASVLVRLIPAPRGTGIVGAPVPKKLLQMAGIDDCYTSGSEVILNIIFIV